MAKIKDSNSFFILNYAFSSSLRLPANNLINGGAFGFEGSLVCTVLATLFTLFIIWWFEHSSDYLQAGEVKTRFHRNDCHWLHSQVRALESSSKRNEAKQETKDYGCKDRKLPVTTLPTPDWAWVKKPHWDSSDEATQTKGKRWEEKWIYWDAYATNAPEHIRAS